MGEMRTVEIRLEKPLLRQWLLGLLDEVSALPDTEVGLSWTPTGSASQVRSLELLIRVERLFNKVETTSLARIDPVQLSRYLSFGAGGSKPVGSGTVDLQADRTADVTVDLTASPERGAHVWTVEFDGRAGMDALIDSLRSGNLPLVSVTDGVGNVVASGRPGSEQPGVLTAMLVDVLAGLRTLIVGAVAGRPFESPVIEDPADAITSPPRYSELIVRRVVDALKFAVYRSLYRAPHWRVGWRLIEGTGLLLADDDVASWQNLADDGFHFYADPFPFEHEGKLYLFVEDFDHRTGKGVISVVEFGDSGPLGSPRPVLSHDVHLSYPFVLEHDGQIWMIPETSNAGTVELYRAVSFPDSWEQETVLLKDLQASDVTPFFHDGRWWMTATVRDGGSFSDSLHIWSAPDLRGPWLPHAHNPVLVDIASARPAGRVVAIGGKLLRPVQDCRAGYGASLRIAEVTRLDDGGFEQKLLGHFTPSRYWQGRRLHTLNKAGRLETIDGSRMTPRFWSPKGP